MAQFSFQRVGLYWEKAARGTDGRTYPWGNEWNSDLANTLESKTGGVVAVGSYPQGDQSVRYPGHGWQCR